MLYGMISQTTSCCTLPAPTLPAPSLPASTLPAPALPAAANSHGAEAEGDAFGGSLMEDDEQYKVGAGGFLHGNQAWRFGHGPPGG